MSRRRVVTLDSHVRNLPWSVLNFVASHLDSGTGSTGWKEFATSIPCRNPRQQQQQLFIPFFTVNELRKFETLAMRGESPTMAVIDAWMTSNCTVQDLLAVFESLQLHSCVERVSQLIPTLPRYEEIAHQPHQPPTYLQSQASTMSNVVSVQQQQQQHSSIAASLSLCSAETERANVHCFPYSHLVELTRSFSDDLKLGEGAFGSVFKGHITRPHKLTEEEGVEWKSVAIKRLKVESVEASHAIIEQFKKEIHVISELKHCNILPLLGYSSDGPELCLIYQYMFNGSLSHRLALCRPPPPVCEPLDVRHRVAIIRGAALGIAYLHERRIIHRDVKSSNILLDSDLEPRIGDFGLIRSIGGGVGGRDRMSTQTTNPIGTMVYMAPEAYLGTITYAMDIFSFGVVILEMLSGLEVMDDNREPTHLTLYVDELVDEDRHHEVFDTSAGDWTLTGQPLLQLATECLEHKYKRRPTAQQVFDRIAEVAK